jgi:2-amino-4-hydroxy-6-hydroxymethyldihydropteridine diphosphokinase
VNTSHLAYIGLGANLGDAIGTLRQALQDLAAWPGVRALRASSLYRSAPVDAGGPDYVNAVATVQTTLSPQALLAALQSIETRHGRERSVRNAPRRLDLDLLLFDDMTLDTPALQLPHPRLHLRAFVLQPLAELAPDLQLPGRGGLAPWLQASAGQRVERIVE